jgi:dihydropteroate synthase
MTAQLEHSVRKPSIMGILNVTPDSFSDGGAYTDTESAVARGLAMVAEGADIIDVGGESTRPGSRPVGADEELSRVIPVIEKLAQQTDALISIDTVKPRVAEVALAVGAGMINDVSNLRDGAGMAELAAKTGAYLVLMHSRGTPETMSRMNQYTDLLSEVKSELLKSVAEAEAVGVSRDRIWIDPGIGFAKHASQSIDLLARLGELVALGYPVLAGPSRKSFIGALSPSTTDNRIGGSAAAVTTAILNGAAAVRVHDVDVMHQTAMVAHAIRTKRIASGGGNRV